jgi:D-alanyl-D-alanine carboxypeptidase/D-alanyl-D-alanine-endopeptidase (penicillin-binding protein 4)
MPRLLLLLALALILPARAAETLPPPVAAALAQANLPASAVGVWVQELEAPRPLLAHQAEVAMNPASVMKLLTAWAALDVLGPAYTWTTRVAIDAPLPTDGRLAGNLYLVGGGDPVLGYDRLQRLLRQVRGLGIERIDGDLVLDASLFPLPPFDPAAFDRRGDRPYNVGPSALLLNFGALRVTLVSDPAEARPRIAMDPPLAGVRLANRVQQEAGPCEAWHRQLAARLEAAPEGGQVLAVEGRWRTDCGRRDWNLAPLPAERYAPALVRALWAELGGRIGGKLRFGTAPASAATVLEESSPPLADVVRDMNKWSNNVIARQLALTLGRQAAAPGEDLTAAGLRAVRESLERAGIDTRGLVMENGAGLSRIARVRAATVGQVLLAAWRRPFMPEFMAALPLAGRDGTARRRLEASPAAGFAHLKTGSVEGVVSIAGYVLDRNSRRYAVVMLVQHPEADAARPAQDALVEWIWAGAGSP